MAAPHGFHTVVVPGGNAAYVVPVRYSSLASIGMGAFGHVCRAYDSQEEKRVAIKKVHDPFQTHVHAKRTYREIEILRHVCHENVISLLDVFTPDQSLQEFKDVYLVTHLMGSDLSRIIATVPKLSEAHIRYFMYQIFRALRYLHGSGIIHRDLKPSNVAVNENCDLRLLDFGLARTETDYDFTGYVSTRWYRAPEVMLSWRHYGPSIDVWSAGCIMAEMMLRHPLFPGSDHIQQLSEIVTVVGTPTPETIRSIESATARKYMEQLPQSFGMDFDKVFAGSDPDAIDLLRRLLVFDARQRITAAQALAHPYLAQLDDPADEPEPAPVPFVDDGYDREVHSLEEWRERIWNLIQTIRSSPGRPGPDAPLDGRGEHMRLVARDEADAGARGDMRTARPTDEAQDEMAPMDD